MKIGKLIRDKRTEHNMTQEELATKLFVTRQLISKWENEKSYPSLEDAIKLSELFDISLDSLIKGDVEYTSKLSLNEKTKKMMKVLLSVLIVISISLASVLTFILFVNGPDLSADDLIVTNVEITELEGNKILNRLTNQEVVIPKDIEITVTFKTDKPFVSLDGEYASYLINKNQKDHVFGIRAEYRFFGNKEGEIVLKSSRDTINEMGSTNYGANIYIHNFTLGEPDKLLINWEELYKLLD
ncbi:MAG: helix-turn-helix transcriptional regulator [Erysipelothrix sp.]